ncbi:MAG: HlyD family efflux transporter periplasmic adaptor subunit [Corynebacterium sp.]|nr:HlyD family efflux transporter periplasmic adaptor subunit [Corynebacterium sp.]
MKLTFAALAAIVVLALTGIGTGVYLLSHEETIGTMEYVELTSSDPISINTSGTLESARTVALSTSLSTLVERVDVKFGQQVKANDLLGVLDTSAVERQLSLEEARHAESAAASLGQIQATQRELNNLNEMVNSGLHPELSGTAQAQQSAALAYKQAQEAFERARDMSRDANSPALVQRDNAVSQARTRYATAAIDAARAGIVVITNVGQRVQQMTQIDRERRQISETDDPAMREVLEKSIADRERAIREYDSATIDGGVSGLTTVASVQEAARNVENAQRAYEYSLAEVDSNLANLQKEVDRTFLAQTNASVAAERGRVAVRQQQEVLGGAIEDKVRSAQALSNTQDVAADQLRMDIGQAEIRSPIDGVVSGIRAAEGEPTAGKLFEISDPSRLVIRTTVSETDLVRMTTDSRVEFTTPATGETVFHGKVTFISSVPAPQKDQTQVTYPVDIEVTGKTDKLRLGATARARIIVEDSAPDLIVLPTAVYESDGKSYVLIIDDNVVTPVEVQAARKDYGIAITGVSEGTLVLNDAAKYRDKIGETVQVERL